MVTLAGLLVAELAKAIPLKRREAVPKLVVGDGAFIDDPVPVLPVDGEFGFTGICGLVT